MALFTIDSSKCKKDKLCVMECPMHIIVMKNNDTPPELLKGAENLCINCGHCVSVCPTGAFCLDTMKSDDCEVINPEWNPGPEIIANYMKARRSVRNFKKSAVEKEKIEQLIKMAAFAPSGHNSRPVEWTVINDREGVKEIAAVVIEWMKNMLVENAAQAKMFHFDMIVKAWGVGIDTVTHNAPSIVLAHGKKANPMSSQACAIALSHLELAAPSLGLGSCWGGFVTWCAMVWKPLMDKLNLPEGDALYGSMLLGYPMFKYQRIPKRESVIHWK
jgi:nitroreductase/NAD-dependent dihydropyrimidine dehydrogenase PreA subunit